MKWRTQSLISIAVGGLFDHPSSPFSYLSRLPYSVKFLSKSDCHKRITDWLNNDCLQLKM